jgi:hydrogenase expression/formation protein HypD
MTMDGFQDQTIARDLVQRIHFWARRIPRKVTIMEVCGTHTNSISGAGLRGLMPENVRLVSGPGCPVCVTPTSFLDMAISLARMPGVTIATFGDLVRVPSSKGSLEEAMADGCDVRVIYSPRDLLALGKELRGRRVVFLAIGFETTAPGVAATILESEKVGNILFLVGHKLIPPAIEALLSAEEVNLDGLILPGHVSAIIGQEPYGFVSERFGIPGVIAGFTPLDVLAAIAEILQQLVFGSPKVVNNYGRVVRPEGNPRAREVMASVFEPCDGVWRGLGEIRGSGLRLRTPWRDLDASRLVTEVVETVEPKGCRCGDVLKGLLDPPECPLFGLHCTPEGPRGPCMVSSEGACGAWYRNERIRGGLK